MGSVKVINIISPLTAALVSILLTLPLLVNDEGFVILYSFTLGPLLLLVAAAAWFILATKASGTQRLRHVLALLLLFLVPVTAIAAPASVLIATHDVEDMITWQLRSNRYRVFGRMNAEEGLPHVLWRHWGFLSVWTDAYLVFDEADALASFASRAGNVPGVPCSVWHVLPLEKRWYVVTLYSGQTWDVCR